MFFINQGDKSRDRSVVGFFFAAVTGRTLALQMELKFEPFRAA